MNSSTLRGLAVLTLLCVLPKLGATVITYIADNRSISISGDYLGNALNLSATPLAPFSDFGSLSGGGLSFQQHTTFGPSGMSVVSTFSAAFTRGEGRVVSMLGDSVFDVTFRVDQYTEFDFSGQIETGNFGILSVTGLGTAASAHTSVPFPIAFGSNGTLAPGDYRIVGSIIGGITAYDGGGDIGTTAAYRFALATRVPDTDVNTFSLLAGALIAVAFYRRRFRVFHGK